MSDGLFALLDRDFHTSPAARNSEKIKRPAVYLPQDKAARGKAVLVTHDGVTLSLRGWAMRTGIHHTVLGSRLRHGWTVERTLTTPPRPVRTGIGIATLAREAGLSYAAMHKRVGLGQDVTAPPNPVKQRAARLRREPKRAAANHDQAGYACAQREMRASHPEDIRAYLKQAGACDVTGESDFDRGFMARVRELAAR